MTTFRNFPFFSRAGMMTVDGRNHRITAQGVTLSNFDIILLTVLTPGTGSQEQARRGEPLAGLGCLDSPFLFLRLR